MRAHCQCYLCIRIRIVPYNRRRITHVSVWRRLLLRFWCVLWEKGNRARPATLNMRVLGEGVDYAVLPGGGLPGPPSADSHLPSDPYAPGNADQEVPASLGLDLPGRSVNSTDPRSQLPMFNSIQTTSISAVNSVQLQPAHRKKGHANICKRVHLDDIYALYVIRLQMLSREFCTHGRRTTQ